MSNLAVLLDKIGKREGLGRLLLSQIKPADILDIHFHLQVTQKTTGDENRCQRGIFLQIVIDPHVLNVRAQEEIQEIQKEGQEILMIIVPHIPDLHPPNDPNPQ